MLFEIILFKEGETSCTEAKVGLSHLSKCVGRVLASLHMLLRLRGRVLVEVTQIRLRARDQSTDGLGAGLQVDAATLKGANEEAESMSRLRAKRAQIVKTV